MSETVRIRMLGNAFAYEYGREYDVAADEANRLTGMGYAVFVAADESEDDDGI